jgi:tRNA (guanine-N7-)-methyltransferase
MGKNKLAKFEDMAQYPHVLQYPFGKLKEEGFDLKGEWSERFFRNTHPVVLELGCGKGEYATGLGRLQPETNFIGIDIKGARMWSGAKESREAGLSNVAFLRTHIELLPHFFAPGEVSEIWLTFPDPQMKKRSKRLTSSGFLKLYRQVLKADGLIHLKTDSPFMYNYTSEMTKVNRLPVQASTSDLYRSAPAGGALSIRTYYEQQWLERGMTIKYLCFVCEEREAFEEPDTEIEMDAYRSFGRSRRSTPASGK